jgi:FKBP-type peptidyl-prolyl cis-trans isomerase SlyD
VITVIEIGDDKVTIDGNHALAGFTLHCNMTVREVRDATDKEIADGPRASESDIEGSGHLLLSG